MADRPPDPDTGDDNGVRSTADRPLAQQEAQEGRSPAGRPGPHRLLPIAGITVAVVAVLAHLGGGAVLVPAHLGLGAALVAYLGGGALVVGLAAFVTMKLLLVFGARRWLRHRCRAAGDEKGGDADRPETSPSDAHRC